MNKFLSLFASAVLITGCNNNNNSKPDTPAKALDTSLSHRELLATQVTELLGGKKYAFTDGTGTTRIITPQFGTNGSDLYIQWHDPQKSHTYKIMDVGSNGSIDFSCDSVTQGTKFETNYTRRPDEDPEAVEIYTKEIINAVQYLESQK